MGAVVALAALDHLAGRIGLLLAIPPGFATAVFPPSGIALAALLLLGLRVWPGVFLGSLSFNLQLALGSSPEATWLGAVPIATSIALGSTLQAVGGVVLMRRLLEGPTTLVLERDVLAFLVVSPAICLISASWGVGTLGLAGLLDAGSLGYAWFTWWVGDAIGVLIFTPLLLTLFGRPREVWRPRILSVSAPLCVAFALVVTVYSVVSEREDEAIASHFRRRVENLDRELHGSLQAHAQVLWAIRSYFAGSQSVEGDEFRDFVARSLSAYPGLKALSWNPLVRDGERAAYESRMRIEIGPAFTIRSRNESGALVPAGRTDEYVVVQYIEPQVENRTAIGFDVLGNPARRPALERARDTGLPMATQRIELVQDPEGGYGFLLILPVYTTDATPPTLAERRASLRGFVVAVVRVEETVSAAFADLATDGIVASLWDEAAPEGERFLGGFPGGSSHARFEAPIAEYAVEMTRNVGGRPWTVRFTPTSEDLAAQPAWQAWIVLAGGLTSTGLLGAFLLVMTGRALLEAERLNEVAEVNERLRMTNEELARFAYAASHDLKTPLRGIGQLSDFLLEDLGEAAPSNARQHLTMIRSRIARMMQLLDDLLRFSQVGWLQEEPESVDTAALVSEVLELSAASDRFRVALIDLPEILTFRVPLTQVLQNLVANAIKHHDRESGQIEVRCRDLGEAYEFSVSDDGPGIQQEHQERIFEMFQSLRPRDSVEGSGMGLALVRKIVTNRRGRVTVESDGTRGTTFRFTWPKASGKAAA